MRVALSLKAGQCGTNETYKLLTRLSKSRTLSRSLTFEWHARWEWRIPWGLLRANDVISIDTSRALGRASVRFRANWEMGSKDRIWPSSAVPRKPTMTIACDQDERLIWVVGSNPVRRATPV